MGLVIKLKHVASKEGVDILVIALEMVKFIDLEGNIKSENVGNHLQA